MPVFFVLAARMNTCQLAQIPLSPNKLPLDPRFSGLAALSANASACFALPNRSTSRLAPDDHRTAAAGTAMLRCVRLIGVGVGGFDGINGNYWQREQVNVHCSVAAGGARAAVVECMAERALALGLLRD
jgi:hypothetical protein